MQRIVIDTNILVNALKSQNDEAKSVLLLEDVFRGKYEVGLSSEIVREYRDVLHRPHLNINPEDADAVIALVEKHGYYIEPRPSTNDYVEMRDEKDRVFFDVAKCLNAKLITRNYKDYPVHELVTLIDELY